jgi:hypothetical protein
MSLGLRPTDESADIMSAAGTTGSRCGTLAEKSLFHEAAHSVQGFADALDGLQRTLDCHAGTGLLLPHDRAGVANALVGDLERRALQ